MANTDNKCKDLEVRDYYSEKKYDISEQILRTILRTNNQNQVESRREKKRIEKESIISKSDVDDPRKTEIENKKEIAEAKRNKILEAKEAKKIVTEEKRKKLIEERENKRNLAKEKNEKIVAAKESKKKEIEDKKAKLLEDRELKKIKLQQNRKKLLNNKEKISIDSSTNSTAKEKLLLERQKKALENLKNKEPSIILTKENSSPSIEERKKLLEQKKKRILEARKAKLDAKKISKDSTFTKNN
jgi:hypothetical protein